MGPVTLQEEAEKQESTYRDRKKQSTSQRERIQEKINLQHPDLRLPAFQILRKRISVAEANYPVGLYYGSSSIWSQQAMVILNELRRVWWQKSRGRKICIWWQVFNLVLTIRAMCPRCLLNALLVVIRHQALEWVDFWPEELRRP